MAKSIRSRWKRKCRAIKRERYAVKELARLKKMLGINEEEKPKEGEVMETEQEPQVIYFDAAKIPKKKKAKGKGKEENTEQEDNDVEMSSDEEKVEVDGENGEKRIFNSKTMKDQNGKYPVWLHKRKIAKMNKKVKRNSKKKTKRKKK